MSRNTWLKREDVDPITFERDFGCSPSLKLCPKCGSVMYKPIKNEKNLWRCECGFFERIK